MRPIENPIVPSPEGDRKRCGRCRELVLLTDFHAHKGRPFGLSWSCKACTKKHTDVVAKRLRARAYHAANREERNERIAALSKARREQDPAGYRADKARWYAALRAKVFAKIGERCSCGESRSAALQIDHVHNDGAVERARGGDRESYLRRVLADETGAYQTLCANCNWLRRLPEKPATNWSTVFRARIIEKLGGACRDCGLRDPRLLHVDHVHGGGSAERRSMGRYAYHRAMLDAPPGKLQLLCPNCNWIKRSASPSEKSGPKRNYA